MKITKSKLKQIIAEEMFNLAEGDFSETSPVDQTTYTELLEAVREVMDLAFGEDSYDIAQKLQALADFEISSRTGQPYPPRQSYDHGGKAKPGTAGLSRTEEEDQWLFGDDDPGFELKTGPSTGSQEHQRLRKFKRP